jgi:hypothetical protein
MGSTTAHGAAQLTRSNETSIQINGGGISLATSQQQHHHRHLHLHHHSSSSPAEFNIAFFVLVP